MCIYLGIIHGCYSSPSPTRSPSHPSPRSCQWLLQHLRQRRVPKRHELVASRQRCDDAAQGAWNLTRCVGCLMGGKGIDLKDACMDILYIYIYMCVYVY